MTKKILALAATLLVAAGCGGTKGDKGEAGTQGTPGTPGNNGNSCSVASNGNGTSTISCSDGTSVTVTNGTNGTSCQINGSGSSRTITCGNQTFPVASSIVDFSKLSAADQAALQPGVVVTGVDHTNGQPVVSLKISDAKGNGVTGMPAGNLRFALLKLASGVNGSANDTWVSYMAANNQSTASSETATATALVDNTDGTYVYTFAKNVKAGPTAAGTSWDPNAVHRLVVLMYASGNPFQPVNVVKEYVPASGQDVTGQNDKVDPAACLECHSNFRAQAGGTGAFHSGQRYDIRVCATCHNDQKRFTAIPGTGSTPNAGDAAIAANGTWTGNLVVVNGEAFVNFPVFIHKIHRGEELALQGGTYPGFSKPYEVTYPQDVRNCTKCHRAPAAKAGNWSAQPSRRACGACHDDVSFVSPAPAGRTLHAGGALADDSYCTVCHPASGTRNSVINPVAAVHTAVAPVDPANCFTMNNADGKTPGIPACNGNTNAGFLASAGAVPAGADVITYEINKVSAYTDTSVNPSVLRPQMTFRFRKNGTPVAMDACAAASGNAADANKELFSNFVGSPSVYWVYAAPQDGINAPADFNASASAYVKAICQQGKTAMGGTSAATITGPDANQFYTVTLTGTVINAGAMMLTGGVGYTYALGTTQPLTQIGLPGYPTTDVAVTAGSVNGVTCTAAAPCNVKTGGLIVPAPDVKMVATGFSGRRAIVSTAKCNACHAQLGANPTFHAGQRNDGESCSWCHNANKTSSGWNVNASTFIHGIHGASKRTVDFTWHAGSCPTGSTFTADAAPAVTGKCIDNVSGLQVFPAPYFAEVTYPGVLNNCEQCHVAGSYDFSASANAAAVPNLLWSTGATGTFTASVTNSPYVSLTGAYGAGYSVSAAGAITAAAGATLVSSPIAAACFSCHDAATTKAHMVANGGALYEARATALAKVEQCLICHGPGTIAAIADVHK